MEIALVLASGAMCIVSFLIGARVGQKVVKGEPVELPSVNPMKAYREHQARREADKEQKRIDAILENIEAYNGTDSGQKDVPGR
jgi:hypothetical protein